jgi:hypothetical protein
MIGAKALALEPWLKCARVSSRWAGGGGRSLLPFQVYVSSRAQGSGARVYQLPVGQPPLLPAVSNLQVRETVPFANRVIVNVSPVVAVAVTV